MKRKMLMAALVAMLCCTTSVTGYAAIREEDVVSPQYENVRQPTVQILITGTTASVKSSVTSISTNVSSINGVLTLQKKSKSGSWDDIGNASWNKSTSMSKLTISGSKTGLSSGTYRAKGVFTIKTTDGKSETVTVYSNEKRVV